MIQKIKKIMLHLFMVLAGTIIFGILGMNRSPIMYVLAAGEVTDIEIIGPTEINSPITIQYKALVRDEDGEIMEGEDVEWSADFTMPGICDFSEGEEPRGVLSITQIPERPAFIYIYAQSKTNAGVQKTHFVVVKRKDKNEINYDANSMTAKLDTTISAGFYFLEILKGKDADAKVSATYCLETSDVDMSFLKFSQNVYVRFYTDIISSRSDIVEINSRPKAPKIKYIAGMSTLKDSFTWDGQALDDNVLLKLEYFDEKSGKWLTFSNLSEKLFHQYIITGKELKVRIGADTKNNVPASYETKVKIPVTKKAPAIKLDYVKGVINFPKNSEVMIYGYNGTLLLFAEKTVLSPNEFLSMYLEEVRKEYPNAMAPEPDFKIYARTPAVIGKSCASQWNVVSIKSAPIISQVGEGNKYGDEKTYVTYKENQDGIVLNASYDSGDKYQFAYSLDGKKWMVIKGGTDVKIAYSKFSANKVFYLRRNGVKEDNKKGINGSWPSNVIEINFSVPAKTISIS